MIAASLHISCQIIHSVRTSLPAVVFIYAASSLCYLTNNKQQQWNSPGTRLTKYDNILSQV